MDVVKLRKNSEEINRDVYWQLFHSKSWISERDLLPLNRVVIEKCSDWMYEAANIKDEQQNSSHLNLQINMQEEVVKVKSEYFHDSNHVLNSQTKRFCH